MKVRLNCGRVGPRGLQRAGDVIDISPVEAHELITSGQAAEHSEPVESMVAEPKESAMLPRKFRKR